MYSQTVYQNQRVIRGSINTEPVLTSLAKITTQEVIFTSTGRDFCQPACPFAARCTLKTAKPNATNLRTFCFKDPDFESLFLSETLCPVHSLIRSLYFIQVCIIISPNAFRPILALFTHFAYTDFVICILPCGMFFFSIPDDAGDWRKLGI